MRNKLVVDIAGYTEGVDPLPLHDASIQMVILKVDNMFARNGRILANSGMPIAAYHWVDPTRDADQQVARTLDTIRTIGLPVVAIFPDFEQYWSRWDEWYRAIRGLLAWNLVSRFGGNRLSKHAKQVFNGFKDAGWKTIGYTRASFVKEYAPQAASWLNEYKWWLAHYMEFGNQTLTWDELKTQIVPRVNFSPDLPPGVTDGQVVGHQFTGDELSLPGLYGNIERTKYSAADVNLFDGQFLEDIGAIPDPKPLPDAQYEAVITAYPRLRVRSGPGTSYPKLYSLRKGAAVKIAKMNDDWAKLRSFGEEWVSAHYLDIVTATSPVPEHDTDVGVGGATVPPVEPIEVDIEGVTYQAVRRFNANCHILVIDPSGKRFHVTPYTGLKTVSQTAQALGAQIVVNGDGWGIRGRIPNSIAASDGRIYQRRQLDFRPWIDISLINRISFAWRKPTNLYNAVSGDRYLVQNGRYNEAISNVTKDPRTAIGLTRDGKLILIVADGRTSQSSGLSFRELANIFLELGTITAINLDGGGSSAMWIKDRIVNVPIDENIPGKERLVANHLCIFTD